jgi:FdhE protein
VATTAAPLTGGLAALARSRSEWAPWLAVLDVTRAATRESAWLEAVPSAPAASDGGTPLLAGATIAVPNRLLRGWLRTLLRIADSAGTATLGAAPRADTEQLRALLEAGLREDTTRIASLAQTLGADAGALGAVAALAPVPLLRACAERWAPHVPRAWAHGWCPVCGSWPAFAEARGLENARRLRCARCAADWPTAWLRCPYCGEDDHMRLGSLVVTLDQERDPAASGLARVATSIDTCGRCRGYLKTMTTLGPTPADDLGLIDLATVELDVAALEHGYARPTGPGAALGAHVSAAGGRLSGWWHS